MYAGIIEERLGWNMRSRRETHWVAANMPDGVPAYVPVVYTDKSMAGKLYDMRREDRIAWGARDDEDSQWVLTSAPDRKLVYLPLGEYQYGKLHGLYNDNKEYVTVYAKSMQELCRDKSIKRIRLGGVSHCEADNMLKLQRTSYVAMHADVARLLRLDVTAPTVQHVIMEEWHVGVDVPIIAKRPDTAQA